MATFSDTILQAIFDYRQLLKRQFEIKERRAKLKALGLDAGIDPTNEVLLYKLAQAILADLESHSEKNSTGYYSYSGVQKFAEHLRHVLGEYELKGTQVIHKTQHASRALLHVIQSLAATSNKLSTSLCVSLAKHGRTIASLGSHDQHHRYRAALKQYQGVDQLFFGRLLQDFEEAL